MRYLRKTEASKVIKQGWRYPTHRAKIREELIEEQLGYCAYTECFLTPMHAVDVEHFDDRLKHQEEDGYWNWYAVLHKWNLRKRSIENFLPILSPFDESLAQRITYLYGAFRSVNDDDVEAKNLIDFLMWNDPSLASERSNALARAKDIREISFSDDDEGFIAQWKRDPANLSYITVLEAELGLSFD